MLELRMRPKNNYIFETDWDELYVLTEHWMSDLQFYADDLRFFRHLIDKYFIWIKEQENQREVEKILFSVIELTDAAQDLLKKTAKHRDHIKDILEEPFTYDSQKFREEHQKLEDEISDFIKSCRKQRKEVFSVIEHVIDKEGLQEIIT
ncbi:hypothetical protein C7S20_12340 [Christiangramia fulva]|uniref:Uncharacterized protein n=1 Tax=Christiangramia fulva TaxID=2126553 RepID=A0A2R3Z6W7_9FLAO|nr:hypothetical protein [Christiangramia fulva]AVR45978.1 hypothetical protein C7S20_12340 [Christiangramia fulva]